RFEQPFAIAERPADGQEQATQKWADLTGAEFGFTLLNNARYGCDALGGRLRLTLVRNSYDPDPDSDAGRHLVRWRGRWRSRLRGLAIRVRWSARRSNMRRIGPVWWRDFGKPPGRCRVHVLDSSGAVFQLQYGEIKQ
ncbi:MAG: hypothetical protein N3B01_10925, partial [Verrucomicrobiae bacterium]|nr:hypothetical protein [Verrucomicrobiae bacterium]